MRAQRNSRFLQLRLSYYFFQSPTTSPHRPYRWITFWNIQFIWITFSCYFRFLPSNRIVVLPFSQWSGYESKMEKLFWFARGEANRKLIRWKTRNEHFIIFSQYIWKLLFCEQSRKDFSKFQWIHYFSSWTEITFKYSDYISAANWVKELREESL